MQVVATAVFRSRLEQIARFFESIDAPQVYRSFLGDLEATIIPNLERFPQIGKPWPAAAPRSTEALMAMAKLPRNPDLHLRHYVHDEFVILYALSPQIIYLVTVRHHRESAFRP